MSQFVKSRLSLVYTFGFLLLTLNLIAQQKDNDFTKRLGNIDGKMSSMSGRFTKLNRLNPSSARRISVDQWSAHFSPFGGKRFPTGKAQILGRVELPSTKIDISTPMNDTIARENFQRVDDPNLKNRDSAVHAVEFRDAYYSKLNNRVDEWMEKVNNMSLRDINRYQFRRDRSDEPGFPVQRAGASGLGEAVGQNKLLKSGLPASNDEVLPRGRKGYWMGPKKTTSSTKTRSSGSNNLDSKSSHSSQTSHRKENFKSGPKPILGPKTIRVEVGSRD